MQSREEELLEKRLDLTATAAVYFQCVGLSITVLLLAIKPQSYQTIGMDFSVAFLFASFIISRFYIYTGKRLEETKTFSLEEQKARKAEYFIKFFCPYALWIGCTLLFRYLGN